MDAEVLIAGAGPVGTLLACELLQQGVRVRLVGPTAGPAAADPHSRAMLLLPRSLELLRRVGVSERLVAAGRQVRAYRYYSEGRLVGTAARLDRLPDTPYPFLLALPQRETERVLADRLAELGGVVEDGTLVGLDQSADGVVATLAGGGQLRAGWLVGADGAASTTRRLLGQRLGGDATDVTYLIADAAVDGPVPDDAQYYYSRGGVLTIVPMRGGVYRIAGNVPHGTVDPSWRALLQELADRRARRPYEIGEPTYARLVRPRCGIAGSFRVGRCFLVGDAAHVITPAGGQGLNLGVQDAVNLGWKLGGVLGGRLAEGVLSTYSPERRAATVRTAATTARIIGVALDRNPVRSRLRSVAFTAADRTGLVPRVLTPLFSQLDVRYGGTAVAPRRPARPGQRVPLFPAPPLPSATPDGPAPQGADPLGTALPATARPAAAEPAPLGAGLPATAWPAAAGPAPFGAGLPAMAPPGADLVGVGALDRDRCTVVLWPGRRAPVDWSRTAARVHWALPAGTPVLDLLPGLVPGPLRRAFGSRPAIAVVRPDGHLVARLEPHRLRDLVVLLRSDQPSRRLAAAPSS